MYPTNLPSTKQKSYPVEFEWKFKEHPNAPFRVLIVERTKWDDGSEGETQLCDLPAGDKFDGLRARLMIAAPDLLEACKKSLAFLTRQDDPTGMEVGMFEAELKDAITKAESSSSAQ